MKRILNQNQYEMSSLEREQAWHRIRQETVGPQPAGGPGRHAGSFRPALAVTVAAATISLFAVWHLGSRQLLEDPGRSGGREMALVEVEMEESNASAETRSVDVVDPVAAPANRASAPTMAKASTKEADPAPVSPVLTGRVVDKATGDPIAHASVLIRGTTYSATTDSLGVYRFENLPAGLDTQLEVRMLSFDPVEIALKMPDEGVLEQEIQMEPVIVATLQAFDVAGAQYMVEMKSPKTEHTVDSQTFEKYAIGSVEEAMGKKGGVVNRAGELYVRGGRDATASMKIDGPASPSAAESKTWGGSVTGGTTPPNGEQVELMYFEGYGVNPFVATEDDALSTFAVDVDNASWTLARNYLGRGMMPPKDAIRVEEFVNTFDAGWARHTDETFKIHTEGAASRFGDGYHLLRIGVVGQEIDDSERKPANLVFVIDVSGSMNRESRLGTVKKSLHILLDQLREGDQVGIVVYGSRGEIKLPLSDISQREKIAAAIDGLHPDGSTNAAEGLRLGYKMARDSYDPDVINRLILCSDGVANTGASTEAGGILDIVRKASDAGITLSTIGFGMGNYNDVLMEKLANQGDGNYYYVDKLEESERVFKENLTSLLQTIAREVKVQVEFDEDYVQRWRLLGYENRDVADEDFRNDKVDAGEVGAGHQVTALYELKLKADANSDDDNEKIGTVRLRYEAPAHDTAHAGEVTEIEKPIELSLFRGDYAQGSPWMKVQTVVAEFAEILRGSYWAKGHSLAELVPVADALASELSGDEQVQELAQMIRQAADLAVEED